MSTERDPYEVVTKKFADRRAHVLVYDATHGAPAFMGTWRGDRPADCVESFGPLVAQGLAGFTLKATWEDLVNQLEDSGFSRADVAVHDVLRDAADVVRVIFWADGLISCQWLTHGPDENARAADDPPAIPYGEPGGNN